MGIHCKICGNGFHESPDALLLCKHKDGVVHLGCCVAKCSQHKQPCEHAICAYDKL